MKDPVERVLIVEDDRAIRDGLKFNFERKGLDVITASDGDEGMKKALESHPDLIILDIMLPGLSGLEILAELRERDKTIQVLVLSARDRVEQKIEGLDLGADDYVTKPFELKELMARAEVMLRRRRKDKDEEPILSFGDVVVDPASRRVTRGGEVVELSKREFDLLALLARSPGRTFSRDLILERVWGWGFEGTTRTVDNFIVALRQKIEDEPSKPRHLRTVRGVGYKLDTD